MSALIPYISELFGNVNARRQVFTSSGTFTAPKTGVYKVRVQAAGRDSSVTPPSGYVGAAAGGAGGYSEGSVELNANQSVVVTVGSQGNPSSFGSYMTANSGGFGSQTVPLTNGLGVTTQRSASAFGGYAWGGSVNITGGSSFIRNTVFNGGTNYYSESTLLNVGGAALGVTGTYNFTQAYGEGYGTGSTSLDASAPGGPGIVIVEWVE